MPTIREAKPEDVTHIFQIVKTQTQHLHNQKNYFKWLKQYYSPAVLLERLEKEKTYVAVTKADLPVASVFFEPTGKYISGLYVHNFFQRQGIGTQLLTHLFEQHPSEDVYCFTEVDNHASQELFKKFGLEVTGKPWSGTNLSEVKWVYLTKGNPKITEA